MKNTNPGPTAPGVPFDAYTGATLTRVWAAPSTALSGGGDAVGLIAQFTLSPAESVPEPTALLLLAGGIVAFGLRLRNERGHSPPA